MPNAYRHFGSLCLAKEIVTPRLSAVSYSRYVGVTLLDGVQAWLSVVGVLLTAISYQDTNAGGTTMHLKVVIVGLAMARDFEQCCAANTSQHGIYI